SAGGGATESFATLDGAVTALSAAPSGEIAVGLDGGRLAVFDGSGNRIDGWQLPSGRVASVVDCAFRGEELLVVDSGYADRAELLARATWDDHPRGQLLALTRSGDVRVVKSSLHAPMGLCLDDKGEVRISLLERASIVDEAGREIRSGLPGYLGRIRRTAEGYLIACIARRDPLIEFLKTEAGFVDTMKRTIDVRNWIAPRIKPDFSHD